MPVRAVRRQTEFEQPQIPGAGLADRGIAPAPLPQPAAGGPAPLPMPGAQPAMAPSAAMGVTPSGVGGGRGLGEAWDRIFREGRVDLSALTPSTQDISSLLGPARFQPEQAARAAYSQALASGAVQRGSPAAAALQATYGGQAQQQEQQMQADARAQMIDTAASLFGMGVQAELEKRRIDMEWKSRADQLGLDRDKLDLARDQFMANLGLDRDRLELSWAEHVARTDLANRSLDDAFQQFMLQLGFDREALAQRWNEFSTRFGEEQRQFDIETEQETRRFEEEQRQFDEQQSLAEERVEMERRQQEFQRWMDKEKLALARIAQDTSLSLAEKQQLFDQRIQAIQLLAGNWVGFDVKGALQQIQDELGLNLEERPIYIGGGPRGGPRITNL